MAKYDPLYRYLRRQKSAEVELTFPQIENLLTAILPKGAQRAEWWANEPSDETRQVQCAAWTKAGFLACPTIERETVVFRKAEPA